MEMEEGEGEPGLVWVKGRAERKGKASQRIAIRIGNDRGMEHTPPPQKLLQYCKACPKHTATESQPENSQPSLPNMVMLSK